MISRVHEARKEVVAGAALGSRAVAEGVTNAWVTICTRLSNSVGWCSISDYIEEFYGPQY